MVGWLELYNSNIFEICDSDCDRNGQSQVTFVNYASDSTDSATVTHWPPSGDFGHNRSANSIREDIQ
ncbi:hypothetical protein [Phormidium sp. CCY1219]|uniref:hypothetical protein n=1 Tax=Phormidium sp. CCY1219 TaxID=2886104 RepID=UPI002D1F283B|nr:hypothetical protein [Phormidium sp. CCY1219]MEB3826824.1 hypothetical protein [Phormidium sp. CCY1219]